MRVCLTNDKLYAILVPKGVPGMNQAPRVSVPDPSQPPEITQGTAKVFLLDQQTPGEEEFTFVVERESTFYKKRRGGGIEECKKRKGKGFQGGGVRENALELQWAASRGIKTTDPFLIAAIREGEEETGIPAEVYEERITGPTWTRNSAEWDMHPWTIFYANGNGIKAQGLVNRSAIQDPKLIRLGKWNKVAWAKFFDEQGKPYGLQKTILAPWDPEERKRRVDEGDVWFYTGHIVGLEAMLLLLGRKDLFDVVLRQVSPHIVFCRQMLEMMIQLKEEDAFLRRLNSLRFPPHPKFAARIIRHFVCLDREDHLDLLLNRYEGGEKDSLTKYRDRQLSLRKTLGPLFRRADEDEGRKEWLEPAESGDPAEEEVNPPPTSFMKRMRESAKKQI